MTMGSRKREKKRDRQKQRRSLKPRSLLRGLPENALVIGTPARQNKMSEVLMDFVEPYSDQWGTAEGLQKLLAVAVIAWNAALVSASERDEFIQRMVEVFPPEVQSDMKLVIDEMLHRKVTHFADNRRMIVNYEVTKTPTGPHLAVLSTLNA
jgi:hypothetical protein